MKKPASALAVLEREADMPKKRQHGTPADPLVQVNIRFSASVVKRVERVAKALGLDMTNLVRMVVIENLAAYERRADEILKAAEGGRK